MEWRHNMAQEEEYQIPIFLINGQLDSGKTRFIQDTIAMGQFAEAKNKLLIVCEEGEEEYSEKLLKDNGVDMVVLEKEELTEQKLNELDKEYDPWIVIVCLLYTSPSPRDRSLSRMPSSA